MTRETLPAFAPSRRSRSIIPSTWRAARASPSMSRWCSISRTSEIGELPWSSIRSWLVTCRRSARPRGPEGGGRCSRSIASSASKQMSSGDGRELDPGHDRPRPAPRRRDPSAATCSRRSRSVTMATGAPASRQHEGADPVRDMSCAASRIETPRGALTGCVPHQLADGRREEQLLPARSDEAGRPQVAEGLVEVGREEALREELADVGPPLQQRVEGLPGDEVADGVLGGGHVDPRALAGEEREVADGGALGAVVDLDLPRVAGGKADLDPARGHDPEELARRPPLRRGAPCRRGSTRPGRAPPARAAPPGRGGGTPAPARGTRRSPRRSSREPRAAPRRGPGRGARRRPRPHSPWAEAPAAPRG